MRVCALPFNDLCISCLLISSRSHLGFLLISLALKDAVTRARAEEIIIPFGIGIAGMVAQTKEMINIKEAYQDARFNCEIDLKTGYKTNAILCMPICNYEGDIIGVAQIINKTNGKLLSSRVIP